MVHYLAPTHDKSRDDRESIVFALSRKPHLPFRQQEAVALPLGHLIKMNASNEITGVRYSSPT